MANGRKYDLEKGLKETLLEVIDLWLSLKFGNESKALVNKLRDVNDIEKLKEIKELIMRVRSLKELEETLRNLI